MPHRKNSKHAADSKTGCLRCNAHTLERPNARHCLSSLPDVVPDKHCQARTRKENDVDDMPLRVNKRHVHRILQNIEQVQGRQTPDAAVEPRDQVSHVATAPTDEAGASNTLPNRHP
jgi:hypothetical protein